MTIWIPPSEQHPDHGLVIYDGHEEVSFVRIELLQWAKMTEETRRVIASVLRMKTVTALNALPTK